MKLKMFFLVSIATVLFTACQISSRQEGNASGDTTETSAGAVALGNSSGGEANNSAGAEPAGIESPAGVDREAVLLENTATKQFDGQRGEEVFRVALLGDSVLSGTVAFTITNSEGQLIYSDEFPAVMLAATYDESINTPAKQEALVKKRIEEFFEEKRFKEQAIEGDQPPYDSFFITKATYDNLKETSAPGFLYLIGKENTKHIAWSPLEEKVVMYFNCC
ncbi:hypothetical protein EDD80_105127 [Anseongella ginsenosidimutans]|uniref:Lipoprotein n=1 Tax=Anseongella ginsenosidimutans TaxID=496056 RepID=A0A4R3KSU5_9SPHI|nr:hypothetical protein [Anseongella ginsenosidimutans]QEC52920.1 hypothetical protein FRZ59_11625 [Anseongella ginsenosidimutans]TCS87313.1 hypothetical protein EDD80_105127 [Anseongella ginsenosidimutans]